MVRQENKKGTKIIQEVIRMDKTDADVKFVLQDRKPQEGQYLWETQMERMGKSGEFTTLTIADRKQKLI